MSQYSVVINGIERQATDQEVLEIEERNAAHAAGADDRAAAQVREERDEKLAATDWRASSDLTMSTEWATYRQALRDITTQEGFPNSVVWPTEPGE